VKGGLWKMRHKLLSVVLIIFFVCIVGALEAQEFVTDGLVSFWTFDQNTINGETVEDVWGGVDGKAIETKVVAGKISEGMEFNGSGSMVEIDRDEKLDITDAISMDAWINISEWLADPNRNVIIARYDQARNMRGLQFSLNPDNGLATYMGHSNGTAYFQTQKGGRNEDWIGQWVHVAFTWDHSDDGLCRLYVDGEEIGSYANQEALEEPLLLFDIPWVIGAMPAQSRYFSGIIDELRVYNRRLSDDEVLQNYNVKSNSVAVEHVSKVVTVWGEIKNW
jgi:hypothetical protein